MLEEVQLGVWKEWLRERENVKMIWKEIQKIMTLIFNEGINALALSNGETDREIDRERIIILWRRARKENHIKTKWQEREK